MNQPNDSRHPRQALFGADAAPRDMLPVCDHYSGVEERMRKSLALQGSLAEHALFDVTLDLEDGAPVGGEHEHALRVAELVDSPANRFDRVGSRLHPVTHPHFEDEVDTLVGRCGTRLAYLMVPKVDSVAVAERAIATIDAACDRHGLARRIPVHALIESPAAVSQVHAIAAHPRLESLSFGLMDFVSAHGGAIPASAMTLDGQFSHPLVMRAKLEIAAACHAYGKTPSHGVVTEFKQTRALEKAATRASKELGYTRMWSIHPDQIRVIIESFAPVVAEVDDAVDILLAGLAAGWGPIALRGTLHDRASYRHYWHVLERAWRTGQPLPEEALDAFFKEAE
ncbi:MAG: HpcH/HpaI aldolase/citrate lyase family protein [Pseudomonadota bacterium]